MKRLKLWFSLMSLPFLPSSILAATKADADSVFAWTELNYPEFLAPAGQTSQSALGYYYRYYPEKDSYLGFREDDQKIYFLPSKGKITLVGDIQPFIDKSALPPTHADALHVYLRAGVYRNWTAEAAPHPGISAHGNNRIFFNPVLVDTLAKKTTHNQGAASIKELYSGDKLAGWAVSVKTQANSDNGNGWYWYEIYATTPGAKPLFQGKGNPTCTGCHSSGQDFIRASLPTE